MMKKAFTLLEVTISITLFMILVLFLYKALDQTKHTNDIFEKKKEVVKEANSINKILLEDIAEIKTPIKIVFDDDKNSIVRFKSNNTYHNGFLNNITYLISSNSKLVRIESSDEFKMQNSLLDFYENAYIDILLEDIEFFEVKDTKNEVLFIIKQKNKERELYKAFKLGVQQ
jgi:type II secretory pathway component PulJ